jgi:alpha-tubulin suppressor-like RCC1 family protein
MRILRHDNFGIAPRPELAHTIAAGSFHSAVINRQFVYTTGAGGYGQLGTGSTAAVKAFTQVSHKIPGLAGRATQVYAITNATWAVNDAGEVWATGVNSSGQLGVGDTVNKNVFTKCPGISGVKKLAPSGYCCYALLENGELWATGQTGYTGLSSNVNRFTKVTSITPGVVIDIAAGLFHGLILIKQSDGMVVPQGIGANNYFQLGMNNASVTTWISVTNWPQWSTTAFACFCGVNNSWILTNSSDGNPLNANMFFAGYKTNYNAGDGNNTKPNNFFNNVRPNTRVDMVTGNNQISLMVAMSGQESGVFGYVGCTGRDTTGAMGRSNTTINLNTVADSTYLPDVVEVVTSDMNGTASNHSICRTADGKIYVTGSNNDGQLGTGNTSTLTAFTNVNAGPPPSGAPMPPEFLENWPTKLEFYTAMAEATPQPATPWDGTVSVRRKIMTNLTVGARIFTGCLVNSQECVVVLRANTNSTQRTLMVLTFNLVLQKYTVEYQTITGLLNAPINSMFQIKDGRVVMLPENIGGYTGDYIFAVYDPKKPVGSRLHLFSLEDKQRLDAACKLPGTSPPNMPTGCALPDGSIALIPRGVGQVNGLAQTRVARLTIAEDNTLTFTPGATVEPFENEAFRGDAIEFCHLDARNDYVLGWPRTSKAPVHYQLGGNVYRRALPAGSENDVYLNGGVESSSTAHVMNVDGGTYKRFSISSLISNPIGLIASVGAVGSLLSARAPALLNHRGFFAMGAGTSAADAYFDAPSASKVTRTALPTATIGMDVSRPYAGMIFRGNKLFVLRSGSLYVIELVNFNPPDISWQLHPYMNSMY